MRTDGCMIGCICLPGMNHHYVKRGLFALLISHVPSVSGWLHTKFHIRYDMQAQRNMAFQATRDWNQTPEEDASCPPLFRSHSQSPSNQRLNKSIHKMIIRSSNRRSNPPHFGLCQLATNFLKGYTSRRRFFLQKNFNIYLQGDHAGLRLMSPTFIGEFCHSALQYLPRFGR